MDKGHSVSELFIKYWSCGTDRPHDSSVDHMIAPQVNSISTVRLDLVRETPYVQVNSPLVNKSKQASQSYIFCILAIQFS